MEDKPLNQELFEDPYGFDFFQAVRLLERMFPERPAVGRDALPAAEVVRFRTRAALDFPPSQIYQITEKEEDSNDFQKLEMFVNFMGLTGALGVLPPHYSETVIERARYRDTSLWEFFDIFTHRAVSLFYRAWEKYRFPVAYERGKDDFTEFLFDFAGLGTRGLAGRLNLPDESMLPYTGLISQKPHSANALEAMLGDYFGVPVKIEQFTGQWLSLDEESMTKLGSVNSKLGLNTIAGTRIWDNQSKFRIRIGAMSFEQFKAFLPNGSALGAARGMIRFMAGDEVDFDLQLVLQAKQVPSCILTTRAKRRPQLGWTSFLKTKKFTNDDEQVILQTL
ncbi:MAG TPA: type VI secretion system baseplate subunit TssG [Pyrinomonadaceae bacterium]|nr:type VI secretion system baseplate subunit TssG [Pyrinomonadaceae bacterium]